MEKALFLLNGAYANQNFTTYNNQALDIEKVLEVDLPCRLLDGDSMANMKICHASNVTVINSIE